MVTTALKNCRWSLHRGGGAPRGRHPVQGVWRKDFYSFFKSAGIDPRKIFRISTMLLNPQTPNLFRFIRPGIEPGELVWNGRFFPDGAECAAEKIEYFFTKTHDLFPERENLTPAKLFRIRTILLNPETRKIGID